MTVEIFASYCPRRQRWRSHWRVFVDDRLLAGGAVLGGFWEALQAAIDA